MPPIGPTAGGELGDALTLDNLDLASLRRDAAAAAADRAASEARLRRVRAVLAQPNGDIAFEELGGSIVLQNLYALKNQTTRREAELATRFGERHPQMLNIRAERQELERRIQAEQQAVLGSVAAEIEAAKAREQALARELDALKSQSVVQGEAAAGLARHERAVASARAQHEAYLTRFRALGDVVETSRPDARLISEATPPQRPSFPQPVMLFGLFSAASLGTGLLVVFFLEQLDRGFRTQRAAEQGLGRRCIGCLPLVRQGRRDANGDRPAPGAAERALLRGAAHAGGRVQLRPPGARPTRIRRRCACRWQRRADDVCGAGRGQVDDLRGPGPAGCRRGVEGAPDRCRSAQAAPGRAARAGGTRWAWSRSCAASARPRTCCSRIRPPASPSSPAVPG